jgi:pyruvate/2-oxoglutarate dehydrogenase complex dihydrolipoamide dehydrogenase (E3) component
MNNVSSAQSTKKTDPEEYDLVILGGGTGSTIAAWTFARQGQRVAAIDRKYVGGSCPNIACLPSKNIIHSAKIASYFRRSEEFGIAKKDFTVDMSAVRGRETQDGIGLEQCVSRQLQKSGAWQLWAARQ